MFKRWLETEQCQHVVTQNSIYTFTPKSDDVIVEHFQFVNEVLIDYDVFIIDNVDLSKVLKDDDINESAFSEINIYDYEECSLGPVLRKYILGEE